MSDPTPLVVPEDLDGERIDKVVSSLTGLPRARVKALLERGLVTRGEDIPVKASERTMAGDRILVVLDAEPEEVAAAPVTFGVVHVDDEVVVVDKPAGLVVHPGAGHATDTLLNGLLERFPAQRDLGEERRFGLLHRLDRDTSGVLVVARRPDVYDDLRAKLARREITRRYLTLVIGEVPASKGTIDAPIARDPGAPTRNTVRVGGRPSRTHYRRLAVWDGCALLEVTLETGRTHQIRVHLAAIDLPVAGDRTYGRVDRRTDPGRTFLHATELVFTTVTGSAHDVVSPLPDDLAAVLGRLGEPSSGLVP